MSTATENPDIRAKIFGHTLDESGRIRACSKSQVKTHMLCARKWYYDKVEKLPRGPKGKGAQESTESHDRMEIWLKTGGDPRNGYERHGEPMIAPYLWAVPWKGGPMQVEEPLLNPTMKTAGGVQLTGFFDAYVPGADGSTGVGVVRDPVIIDHKFLKTFKYADSEEDLEDHNPEPVFYMAWALTREPNAAGSTFRHHNHAKTGPRSNLPVEIYQTRAKVFERMAALGKYIDGDMQATAAAKRAEDVAPAPVESCKAFGGCEFRHTCPDAPQKRFMKAMAAGFDYTDLSPSARPGSNSVTSTPTNQGYNLMGLMDDIDSGSAPAAPSGAPPAAPTPAAPKLMALMEAKEATKGGFYLLPDGSPGKCKGPMDGKVIFCKVDKSMVELDGDDMVRNATTDNVVAAQFGVTIPAPVSEKKRLVMEDVPSAAPQAAKVDTTPAIDPKAGVVPPDAPKDTTTVSQAAQAGVPAPITEVAVKVAVAEVAGTEAPKRTRGPNKKKAADIGAGFILVVNAASNAGESLDGYVADLAAAICDRLKLADLRLAPKDSDAAFMGWRGLLAIEAKKNPPGPGIYTLSSGDFADPVIEALAPLATAFIKGSLR